MRLRAPETLAPARLDAIVAALREGGIAEVEVEPLGFAVETSRVGYYLAPDRAAAEALARLAAPLVTPGAALPLTGLRQAGRRSAAGAARPLGGGVIGARRDFVEAICRQCLRGKDHVGQHWGSR